MKASNKALKELTYKIEGCLKYYKGFKQYSKENRIRFREWYNQGPWFFPLYKKVMDFLVDGKSYSKIELLYIYTFNNVILMWW
jgi:hypothetical protein